ncbi:MAG: amidohydrolase family protein [Candidatus Thermoplasmatota archaeon]|nr:amidohydrolase family protein [Candidatus Thermoplasmatota archaeon]
MNLIEKSISGYVFHDGRMRKGTVRKDGDLTIFEEGVMLDSGLEGTLIPAPVNSHSHIGDSFVTEEPMGNLKDVVGPGGFKERQYGAVDQGRVQSQMKKTMDFMKSRGTATFIDFREGGKVGAGLLRELEEDISPIILGRPTSPGDGTLSISDGAGMSSIADHDMEALHKISDECRREGKIFAIHSSEFQREDIETILSLEPGLLIHCIECSDEDLSRISKKNIPVAVTPRSNIFFGKRPDYSRFLEHGVELLLGTDNVMTVEPDIFEEMHFLYTWQRSTGRINPDEILKTSTENPWKFIESKMKIGARRSYLFFRGLKLTSYEIVTRSHMHNSQRVRII